MLTILLLQAVLGQAAPVPDSVALSAPVAAPAATEAAAPPVAMPLPVSAPAPVSVAPDSATAVDSTPPAPAPVLVVPSVAPPPSPESDRFQPLPRAVAAELGEPGGEPARPAPPPVPQALERFGAWQIGVAAGDAGGYGLSLRRWIGGFDAIQINCAPYMHRENIPGTEDDNDLYRDLDSGFRFEASVAMGLTWLHSHAEREFFHGRLGMNVLSYVAGGADLEVEQQQIDHIVTDSDNKKSVVYDDYYRVTREFSLGTGGGLEFQVWRMSVYGLLGLQGWYEYTSEDFGFRPDGQLGMHFRF